MGKRLILQRRGKGSPTFTAPITGTAALKFIPLDEKQKTGVLKGEVIDLFDDPTKNAVVSEIVFENNLHEYVVAAEGLSVGQKVEYGKNAALNIGNVLPLQYILEGVPVFNIEKNPGDGGKFVRTSGLYGLVVSKEPARIFVKMPSGKLMEFKPNARACIGCISGGGKREKPLVKAGKAFYARKAKKKWFPTVRGVAMNAIDHPFGGSQHHAGKSKSTSRHAAAGRKVGAIASSRTGRRKKN
ncbi:MAG: 50S ribosomal protein L2 [Candidatus Diapherotrites archaeon]|nr:50S ribosomal protein L2 [Candidatus Diapherotrites archaeon]